MRNFYCLILTFCSSILFAQNVDWSHSADHEMSDRCISFLPNGNSFYSVITTNSSGQSGYNDTYCYLRKYKTNGQLLWSKMIEPGYYGGIGRVTHEKNGKLLLNGYIWGGYYYNGDTTLSGLGTAAIFIDTNGTCLRHIGFRNRVYASFDADSANNIYFFGKSFDQTIEFGSDSVTFTSPNPYFILKSDENGVIQWIKEFPVSVYSYHSRFIEVVGDGLYFGATFEDSIRINGQSFIAQGDRDIILGKADLNGNISWLKTIGNAGTDNLNSFTVSDDGSKIILSVYSYMSYYYPYSSGWPSTVNFDQISLFGKYFLTMLDSNGTVQWARTTPTMVNSTTISNNSIVASGNDLIMAKYNMNGQLQYSRHETNHSYDILPLSNNQYIVGGSIYRTNFLGTFIPWYNYYSNYTDLLIAKINYTHSGTSPIALVDTITKRNYCLGQSGALRNLCSNADSINWYIPGATPERGNILYQFTFNSAGVFPLYVMAYKGAAVDTLYISNMFTVNPPPSVTVTGDFEFCQGDSANLSTPPGMDRYQWSTGDTTLTTKIGYGGWHYLNVKRSGCWNQKTFYVEMNYNPAEPVINGNNNSLWTSVQNQGTINWYFNDTIYVHTGLSYTATQNGNYSVVFTDTNGCSSRSNTFPVFNISITENSVQPFRIYPNPAGQVVYIELEDGLKSDAAISLLDIRGVIVKHELYRNSNSFSLTDIAKGIYTMRIQTPTEIFRMPLIIQ